MQTRRLFVVALIGAVAIAVAGCGGSASQGQTKTEAGDELTATPSSTASPAAGSKVIAVTITADSVTPSGTRVEVKRNQPIVLEIDAVAAGEIHVHSTPEQHIEFPAGKSAVTLTIDQPGVVDVEDHSLDKLIVQLEVK
jgi:uncharacterized iron-regulated membrane protein